MWTLYTYDKGRYIKLFHAARVTRARELAYHFIKRIDPTCAVVISDNPHFLHADDTPEYPYVVYYDDKIRRICCEVIEVDSVPTRIRDYILKPDGKLGKEIPHVI